MEKIKIFLLTKIKKYRFVLSKANDIPSVITSDHFYDYPLKFLNHICFDFTLFSDAVDWKQKKSLISKNIILWCHLVNVMLYVALISYEGLINLNDYQKIILVILIVNLGTVLVVKMSRYFWMKNEVMNLKNSLLEFYPKVNNPIAIKYLQYFRTLRFGIKIFYIICLTAFALIPVIVYMIYGEIVTPIPSAQSLFDATRTLIYPLIFIWQMIQCYEGLLIHFGFDLMTITLIVTIAMEWSILSHDFSKFVKCEIH